MWGNMRANFTSHYGPPIDYYKSFSNIGERLSLRRVMLGFANLGKSCAVINAAARKEKSPPFIPVDIYANDDAHSLSAKLSSRAPSILEKER